MEECGDIWRELCSSREIPVDSGIIYVRIRLNAIILIDDFTESGGIRGYDEIFSQDIIR